MQDTINIDLSALKNVFHDLLSPRLNRLHGCVAQVFISPEVLAAIRAGYLGGINGVVGPCEFRPALLAGK